MDQNIPLRLAEVGGTSWMTSQNSTALPWLTRMKSEAARPVSSGVRRSWYQRATMSPSAMTWLMSMVVSR